MTDVIIELKQYIIKLNDLKSNSLDKWEKVRLDNLLSLLETVITENQSEPYVMASSITKIRMQSTLFFDRKIKKICDTLGLYCKDILESRHKMITLTLEAIQICKTIVEDKQEFPEDLCLMLDQSSLELSSYCKASSFQKIIAKLRSKDLFSINNFNFELKMFRDKQEEIFFDNLFLERPNARQKILKADFSVLMTEELKSYYNKLYRYGKIPKISPQPLLTRSVSTILRDFQEEREDDTPGRNSEPVTPRILQEEGSYPGYEIRSQSTRELMLFDLILATKPPPRVHHPAGNYSTVVLPQYFSSISRNSNLPIKQFEECSLSAKKVDIIKQKTYF